LLRVKWLNSHSVRKVQRSNKGATTLAQPTFTHTSSKNREKQRGQRKVSIFISSLPPPLLLKAITYQCLSVLSSFLSFLLLVRIRFSISFFIADNIYIERGIYSCLHHLIHLFHIPLPHFLGFFNSWVIRYHINSWFSCFIFTM
jgi:hypothetical protein